MLKSTRGTYKFRVYMNEAETIGANVNWKIASAGTRASAGASNYLDLSI